MLAVKHLGFIFLWGYLLISCGLRKDPGQSCDSKINFWYGDKQSFGTPGLAQQWINILGNVNMDAGLTALYYSLNGSDTNKLSWGRDNHRLANDGDFNIDIHYTKVKEGINKIVVTMIDSLGEACSGRMEFDFSRKKSWPLPYSIEWEKVNAIQEVVQIVDGNWRLTPDGIRVLDPWYDRILAIGDSSWRDFEISTSVIFHAYTSPVKAPPNYGVSHVALASRWPGHDWDDRQPHIKWYPLGATCEFQLKDDLDSCRWRILGGRNIRTEDTCQTFPVKLEVQYMLKSRVESMEDQTTQYSVKIWPASEKEPDDWHLTAVEGREDIQSGSALIIAHNTEVTFGDVTVNPLE